MNTPRSFRAEAIVLNHRDWGEADRLVTLYTRQRGKIRAVAKGHVNLAHAKVGIFSLLHRSPSSWRGHGDRLSLRR